MIVVREESLSLLKSPPEPRVAFTTALVKRSSLISREGDELTITVDDVTLKYAVILETPEVLDCELREASGGNA